MTIRHIGGFAQTLFVGILVAASPDPCRADADARAASLVADVLADASRDEAAEALACPPDVSASILRETFRQPEVAKCIPAEQIRATSLAAGGKGGLWTAYVRCKDGHRLSFTLIAVAARSCGSKNAGFTLGHLRAHGKSDRTLYGCGAPGRGGNRDFGVPCS